VRLVGENVEVGVYTLSKALEISRELEVDLVEISPNATPPVCKAMDYKKFVYEQKKREKNLKVQSNQSNNKRDSFWALIQIIMIINLKRNTLRSS
jgi:translation initiation factor IF-3